MKSFLIITCTLLTTWALTALALPTFTPQLLLVNPQGEKTPYGILYPGTTFIGGKIGANTIPSNLTGSTAYPVANTYAAVSAKLTPAMLLTGFVSGAGTVASTDTVLQGIDKLSGNTQNLPVISNVLTGFSAGAGAVSSSDSILQGLQKIVGNQALGLTPGTPQAISGAGAVSVSVMETTITNAGSTYAITLAAPSGIDGQVKIIKAITTMAGTVTMALTNVSMGGSWTPTGTATLTFTSVGDSAVFIAIGSKWVYLGGSAVAS